MKKPNSIYIYIYIYIQYSIQYTFIANHVHLPVVDFGFLQRPAQTKTSFAGRLSQGHPAWASGRWWTNKVGQNGLNVLLIFYGTVSDSGCNSTSMRKNGVQNLSWATAGSGAEEVPEQVPEQVPKQVSMRSF